jgi:hypothetical protein
MTGPEYRTAVKKLFASNRADDLGISSAGRFFGIGQATANRWANDGPPTSVSILLQLMRALHVKPAWVNLMIGRKNDGEEI